MISESVLCNSCKKAALLKVENPHIFDCDKRFVFYPYLSRYVDVVLYWKNEGMRSFSFLFAYVIASFIKKTASLKNIPIVPVPPRKSKLKIKGWDQIEDICSILECYYSLEILRLLKRDDGRSQKGLSKTEREQNLIEKIHLKEYVCVPKKLIILDDVVTTGSTMKICTSVLKEAGCGEVVNLVLFFN